MYAAISIAISTAAVIWLYIEVRRGARELEAAQQQLKAAEDVINLGTKTVIHLQKRNQSLEEEIKNHEKLIATIVTSGGDFDIGKLFETKFSSPETIYVAHDPADETDDKN